MFPSFVPLFPFCSHLTRQSPDSASGPAPQDPHPREVIAAASSTSRSFHSTTASCSKQQSLLRMCVVMAYLLWV